MHYQLSQISEAIHGEAKIVSDTGISSVFIDSRTILTNKKSLFFAIRGKNNDGHDYIEYLVEHGVRNFVAEKVPTPLLQNTECNFIIVQNSLLAFQKFGAWHRQQFNIPIIGITGSNGKTIVKEWLFYVLNETKRIARSPKSYNSQVGVPLSLLLLEQHHQLGIFEAGISLPGEMKKLQKIIKPQIGIFTNIGDAHQENFKAKQHKVQEKARLFKDADLVIYCVDYDLIEKELKAIAKTKKPTLFSWSVNKDADLKIKAHIKENSTEITGLYQKKKLNITIPYIDKASIENAIHVWAFAIASKNFTTAVADKFETLPVIGMRLELVKGTNNCSIINDTYNSDLNSIKIALDVLKRQRQHQKKCLIISDILQSGENQEQLYTTLLELVESSGVQKLIAIGKQVSNHLEKKSTKAAFFKTTDEFLGSKTIHQFNNEAILIKGAREFEFERISEFLQQKTHRTVMEINLEAMENNLNYFRSLIQSGTRMLVMVKAFSYGSGSYEIAHFLEHQRVDYLGVAFTDEGVALRKAGVRLPIIVMNPEEGSYKSIITYQLEPEIYSFRSLEKFNLMVERTCRSPYPVHLKIETGMNRLGFDVTEIEKLTTKLPDYKYIHPISVFSHLAASGDPTHRTFSLEQISYFKEATKKIQAVYKHKLIRHILNTGGVEYFPDACFEMVRVGLGLYGLSSKPDAQLQNVSTLKSHITQVRLVKKGETIGYSRNWLCQKDTKIAILPIGYADGLDRKFSNGNGHVIIKGQKALYVGNICMDMCMVDITDIDASEGDEVIIFGSELPLPEMASKINSIPYEVLTGVSQRVKRVYIH